ncbi:D-alanyl-D-alanine carboxypeptidase family protein [Stomatohabitans albus]|uniref:D-alanyl-D-alanine carboxypeptidase family protein n=1 Tax=Stomatohabitans albus TaxID=3110766 RepID=UPI00300CA357
MVIWKQRSSLVATAVLVAVLSVPGAVPGHAQGTTTSEPQASVGAPANPFDPGAIFRTRINGEARPFPEISATNAILIDGNAMATLGEKNGQQEARMASTTKVMTILLGIEARDQGLVGPTVTISPNAVAAAASSDSATLKLQAGQQVAFDDLLAATLMASGNDGAVAIAEHVAGSEAAFVQRMNERAAQLGLTQTRYLNASGFTDDPGHHTSPLDLAVLGMVAMSHPDFARWAQAQTLDLETLGSVSNRNELLGSYLGVTGIKTGFTNAAGQCLVASAERDGRVLYAVVLGSKDRVADMTKLFDYGFNDFSRRPATEAGEPVGTFTWTRGDVEAIARKELAVTVPAGTTLMRQIVWNSNISLPVTAGTELGTANLILDGQILDSAPVVAQSPVEPTQGDGPGAIIGDALLGYARVAQSTQSVDVAALTAAAIKPTQDETVQAQPAQKE